jgi:FlaA1/EpsC-like NDP-sugar epimerase
VAIGALSCASEASGLFVLEMGEPVSILEIARRMIHISPAAAKNHGEVSVEITGLRPGDKLHEDLVSHGETLGAEVTPRIRAISGKKIHAELLDAKFRMLEEITKRQDRTTLLEILREIVPEYQPLTRVSTQPVACSITAAGAGDD